MVGPAAKRDAVAHLRADVALSERRACQIVAVDRKTVRYVSKRPADAELHEKLRDLANAHRPDTHALLLLQHSYEPTPLRAPQRPADLWRLPPAPSSCCRRKW